MNDNTTNDSNRRTRTLERIRVTTALITSGFEIYVSAEVLCLFLTGEHLHTHALDYFEAWRERATQRASVHDTRDMIRDLPETE